MIRGTELRVMAGKINEENFKQILQGFRGRLHPTKIDSVRGPRARTSVRVSKVAPAKMWSAECGGYFPGLLTACASSDTSGFSY